MHQAAPLCTTSIILDVRLGSECSSVILLDFAVSVSLVSDSFLCWHLQLYFHSFYYNLTGCATASRSVFLVLSISVLLLLLCSQRESAIFKCVMFNCSYNRIGTRMFVVLFLKHSFFSLESFKTLLIFWYSIKLVVLDRVSWRTFFKLLLVLFWKNISFFHPPNSVTINYKYICRCFRRFT